MYKTMKIIAVLIPLITALSLSGCKPKSEAEILVELTPVGMVSTTMEGNIIYANPAYQKMLGYTLEELKKLTYQDITPPIWHPVEKEMINRALEKEFVQFEKEYIRKDGTVLPISITGWIIKDKEGKQIGTVSMVVDISKLKQAR